MLQSWYKVVWKMVKSSFKFVPKRYKVDKKLPKTRKNRENLRFLCLFWRWRPSVETSLSAKPRNMFKSGGNQLTSRRFYAILNLKGGGIMSDKKSLLPALITQAIYYILSILSIIDFGYSDKGMGLAFLLWIISLLSTLLSIGFHVLGAILNISREKKFVPIIS